MAEVTTRWCQAQSSATTPSRSRRLPACRSGCSSPAVRPPSPAPHRTSDSRRSPAHRAIELIDRRYTGRHRHTLLPAAPPMPQNCHRARRRLTARAARRLSPSHSVLRRVGSLMTANGRVSGSGVSALVSQSGHCPRRVVSITSTAVCVDRYRRRPSGLTTTSRGWVGVAIVVTTAPRCASMTVRVRAIWLAT